MAFNLNDFRNAFTHGGARRTQFEVQLTWPDAVRGATGVAAAERDFRFLCNMSQIPGEKHAVIPVKYFGRVLKYAGDREYESLSLNILNDEDFKVRKALEAWIKAISDRSTTVSQFSGGIASGSYVTDGMVTQLSRNTGGQALHQYKFVGMWPVVLSPIELSWNSSDEFEVFSCEFAYQWWEPIDSATGAIV